MVSGIIASSYNRLDVFKTSSNIFSLRDIYNTGDNLVRVRRSSDNLEQDFNYSQIENNEILTFVGSGNGFVSIWYDQSIYNNNARQAIDLSQPRLVVNGQYELNVKGQKTVNFDTGERTFLSLDYPFYTASSKDIYALVIYEHTTQVSYPYLIGTNPSDRGFLMLSLSSSLQIRDGIKLNTGLPVFNNEILNYNELYMRSYKITPNTMEAKINNNSSSVLSIYYSSIGDNFSAVTIGQSGRLLGSNISEIVLYNSPVEEFETDLRTNINNHYNIY